MVQRTELKSPEEVKWHKIGDFSNLFSKGEPVKHTDVSKNSETITIIHGATSHCIGFIVHSSNKNLIGNLFNLCQTLQIPISDPKTLVMDLGELGFDSTGKPLLAKFLQAIHKIRPLPRDILEEIYTGLNLEQLFDPKGFLQDLIDLVNQSKFQDALDQAKSATYFYDILWDLGQFCESTGKITEAIQCYQAIPAPNPHYPKANIQIFHISMQLKESHDGSLDQDDEDPSASPARKKLEIQFGALLKASGTEFQPVLDQIYHRLCGGDDLKPSVKNVKPNEETLLAMSLQMSELKLENQKLQEKVIELEKKLAKKPKPKKKVASALPSVTTVGKFGKLLSSPPSSVSREATPAAGINTPIL